MHMRFYRSRSSTLENRKPIYDFLLVISFDVNFTGVDDDGGNVIGCKA